MTTANEVVSSSFDDVKWTENPVDLSTTDGIQRAIKANTAAIHALANHIDGVKTDAQGNQVKHDPKVNPGHVDPKRI